MNVNTPTAKARSGNERMSGSEPKTASLIAIYGNEASYAWNVLEDLKAAGASYTRRNIIADMFRRLGVQ
ncbi:TPA: hypothetical protein ACHF2V_004795 [Citrobacter farmeri]|jgi:hypothetical protein|uniref:hypothetical protein n=1 Tax=Citrobacter TaxID=544 RepID=UPI000E131C85|nr:hypothetical protein [Salmonella enterica]BCU51124.1 hypothetical protein CIAM_46450 [Citrobacter amalonaticus]STA62864.1 Uncharacterised protein [Citrobacter amalonaticus]HCD1279257.1 hypothetical protein [Citrobacter amalonaticus]